MVFKSSLEEINNYINNLKSKSKNNQLHTNYFKQDLRNSIFETIKGENSIAFLNQEIDFHRLYFYASDLEELTVIIKGFSDRVMTIDFYAKIYSSEVEQSLINAGFYRYAVFERLVNYKFWLPKIETEISYASEENQSYLYERMHTDFDKFVDHLPDKKELNEFIRRKQVLLNKVNGRITGYLVYEVQNKRVVIRAWRSMEGDIPMGAMSLIGNLNRLLSTKDIRMVYGWVNVENEHSIVVLKRMRYQFDGLTDYIYVKDWAIQLKNKNFTH